MLIEDQQAADLPLQVELHEELQLIRDLTASLASFRGAYAPPIRRGPDLDLEVKMHDAVDQHCNRTLFLSKTCSLVPGEDSAYGLLYTTAVHAWERLERNFAGWLLVPAWPFGECVFVSVPLLWLATIVLVTKE